MAALGTMEMTPYSLQTRAEASIAVQICDAAVLRAGQDEIDPNESSSESHTRKIARPNEFQEEDFIDLSCPVLFGPTAEIAARDESCFVVISAIIRSSRM